MVHRVDKDLRPRSVLRVEFDQYTHSQTWEICLLSLKQSVSVRRRETQCM